MRVLVTGASGFIGREIVGELLKENHQVVCMVSQKNKNSEDLPNVFPCDISDSESLGKLENIGSIDAFIHTAGLAHQFGKISSKVFREVNVTGTENVGHLAVKLEVKLFVLISSVAVYGGAGKNNNILDETDVCKPRGIYAESKFESEEIAREICEKNGIGLTILRPVTVIGENDRGNTARLIKQIDKKKFIWIGKGKNRKSLIYKTDVARACLKVLSKKKSETEIYNLTCSPVAMSFIVAEIASNLQRKIPGLRISVPLLEKIFLANKKTVKLEKISKLKETVEKWISEDVFSGEKIAEIYNFRPQTSVSEAIRRQVAAYQAKKNRK